MKKTIIICALAALAATAPATAQTVEPGPMVPPVTGIVIEGSQPEKALPEAARKFLAAHYADDPVAACNENFIKQVYKVVLEDGTDILFTKEGKVRDISAPEGVTLPAAVVRAVLPRHVYDHLDRAGYLSVLGSLKGIGDKGFKTAGLNNEPPQMVVNIDDLFIVGAM